jgi:RNA polymerase sigma factor (sigma-70 family)
VKRTAPGTRLGDASELAVVALAIQGDEPAFGELVRRRQAWLRQLLRRLTRDPALADDLAQQALVAAWKSIHTLKSAGAFGGWFRRLAVNCWLQQVRAKPPEVTLTEEMLAQQHTLSATAERMDLDAALAMLPADARLCVVLAYSEGMSHAEISESTAIPLGTVKSHIARGSAHLREILRAYGDPHA